MMRLAIVILALLVAAPAVAQPGPGPSRGPGIGERRVGQRAPRAPRQQKREKVKQRIRAMRAWVLTEQLDLDVATAEKMFPVLARHDDELARLLAERKQLRAQLAAARRTRGNAAQIDALLDKLVANQRARWNAEDQRFAELRTMLTAEQAAALLDLLPEVDRKILQELRQAVERGPARPPSADSPDERGPYPQGDAKNPFDDRK